MNGPTATGTGTVAGSLLEVWSVSKRYAGNPVLTDVTVCLRPGETVAVVGENGAGKSTLAKIVAGAIRPDSGELRLEGRQRSFGSPSATRCKPG